MVTSSWVRAHLVRALEAELVGPYSEHEELDRAPSRTYLTGFLVPREDRNADPLNDADDDTETEEAEADGDEEVVAPAQRGATRRHERHARRASWSCVAMATSRSFRGRRSSTTVAPARASRSP
jgi:hypothetical protein